MRVWCHLIVWNSKHTQNVKETFIATKSSIPSHLPRPVLHLRRSMSHKLFTRIFSRPSVMQKSPARFEQTRLSQSFRQNVKLTNSYPAKENSPIFHALLVASFQKELTNGSRDFRNYVCPWRSRCWTRDTYWSCRVHTLDRRQLDTHRDTDLIGRCRLALDYLHCIHWYQSNNNLMAKSVNNTA